MDRARLVAMLERAAIVAPDDSHAVTLTMDAGAVMGSSASNDRGALCETMPAAVQLQEDGRTLCDISFDVRRILQTLQGIKADTVTLTLTEAERAARIRFEDAPALSWVLMPVRVKEQ